MSVLPSVLLLVVLGLLSAVHTAPSDLQDLAKLKAALGGVLSSNASEVPAVVSVDLVSLMRLVVKAERAQGTGGCTPPSDADSSTPAPSSTSAPATTPRSSESGLQLEKLGSRNYYLSRETKLEWADAVTWCQKHGMQLVSVETQEENDLILDYFSRIRYTGDVLISGHKQNRSSFVWLTGEPIGYHNWNREVPDIHAWECIVYAARAWYRFPCASTASKDAKRAFLCEQ